MRSALIGLVLAAALATGGCARPPYVHAAAASFSPPAPQSITFATLVQHAAQIGYVIYAADPASGVFQVYSRMIGRVPRRATASGVMRGNLLTVEVRDAEVRVSAIGRDVAEDGSMHPRLAQEVDMFAESLRDAASAITTSGGAMPEPPGAYGVVGGYAVGSSDPSGAPAVSGAVVVPSGTTGAQGFDAAIGAPPASAPSAPQAAQPAYGQPASQPELSPAQRLGAP